MLIMHVENCNICLTVKLCCFTSVVLARITNKRESLDLRIQRRLWVEWKPRTRQHCHSLQCMTPISLPVNTPASQQTPNIHPMLDLCWAIVFDTGPTFNQHSANSCSPSASQKTQNANIGLMLAHCISRWPIIKPVSVTISYFRCCSRPVWHAFGLSLWPDTQSVCRHG